MESTIFTFKKYLIGEEIFSCDHSDSSRKSCNILLIGKFGDHNRLCPAKIQFFFTNRFTDPNSRKRNEYTFAFVRFYLKKKMLYNDIRHPYDYRISEELWYLNSLYPETEECIVPISKIVCKFIPGLQGLNDFMV